MRRIWSYGFMLALTGCVSTGQGATGAGTYTYSDILKPHGHARGEAAEQAATTICDGGNPQLIGTSPFNACMRGRGWRLAHFEPAPSQPDTYDPSFGVGSDTSSPPPPPPPPPPPQPFVSIGNPSCPFDVCY
ncbi:MAG: hypothetical protein ACHQAY_14460 [Hyphomicrobiales bacterium]